MNNYIFPFLWMRGEPEEILRTEIAKIDECGIKAVCLEARPHDDFCGSGWWCDFDIVLDEAKKRGMKILREAGVDFLLMVLPVIRLDVGL